MNSDFYFYQDQKFIFDNTNCKNPAEKFQQSYYLMKTKIELEQRQKNLNDWKTKLDDESNCLDNLCASEDAKQKIAIIAASILRKNLPVAQNLEREQNQLATIKHNLKLTKTRLNFVPNYSSKKNYCVCFSCLSVLYFSKYGPDCPLQRISGSL